MTYDNDGRFPDECAVLVKYPRTPQQDRESWPWLPGSVLEQCGPDEWKICVDGVPELATLADGSAPQRETPDRDLYYPVCFRDSSEMRRDGAR